MSVDPSAAYVRRATKLVEANAARYPELLAHQLASAMQGESEAVAAAYRIRCLVGVCLRLAERADVKPRGDEVAAVQLARKMTHADPRRCGGNDWLEVDRLRLDLAGYTETGGVA